MKKAAVVTIVAVLVLTGCVVLAGLLVGGGARPYRASASGFQRFETAYDFVAAFKAGARSLTYDAAESGVMKSMSPAPQALGTSIEAPQHSTTNVQVEGVDEADMVKTDGNFIYVVSGSKVFIVAAYPAAQAGVVAKLDLGDAAYPREMFINDDRLVVIGDGDTAVREVGGYRPGTTFIRVFDVSNRAQPRQVRDVEYEGSYSTSRMVGENVHVVLTTTPYVALDKLSVPDDIIPQYSDTSNAEGAVFLPAAGFAEIDIVDPRQFSSFLSIVSFSVGGGDEALDRRVIAGFSENVYASTGNLYVASPEYQYAGYWEGAPSGDETTTVFKFRFDGPAVSFESSAKVPGTILNQFSMDEADGYFRIATTRGHVSREGSSSTNNVYVLDGGMNTVGSLEGLAPGERIYSVRFMGPRAYMVTFKKVDPLFVLDLSAPAAPRVLGELKIPGYSDYLHPYDENHIIGVGKNTVEASPEEGGNFAWYQGMKIAIFDVTDVSNPREMHKVEIGDRGTDSNALYDHKAFLFDRDRGLMVLPIQLAELTPEQKADPETRDYDYGEYTFQGAYVYDVTLENGFELKGRITHRDEPPAQDDSCGYYGSDDSVMRSLYIEDDLYTVSGTKIKINDLADLAEIKTVVLE